MTRAGVFRSFLTLHVQPAYAFIGAMTVAAFGVYTLILNPAQLDSNLAMLLFIQMFLASTGFAGKARRGHFDPILVDRRRSVVCSTHFLVSALPGIAAWLPVAVMAIAGGNRTGIDALIGGRAAALLIVSAVAWSAGFFLPRGAAGILWAVALIVLVVRGVDPRAMGVGSYGLPGAVTSVLACPFLLLGVTPVRAVVVAIDALIAIVIVVVTCRVAERLDFALADYS